MVRTNIFAYRTAQGLETLEKCYIDFGCPDEANLDSYILRLPIKDQPSRATSGFQFHFEPIDEKERNTTDERWLPMTIASHTTLSDLYYHIVQDSYYELEWRDFAFGHIGAHVMNYMSWSVVPWNSLKDLNA